MAIRGSLSATSLVDFLQLLALGQKIGRVSITGDGRTGQIFVDRGFVVRASLVGAEDRLGEMLVREGGVPRAEMRAAILESKVRPNARLGELLVERGTISRETLQKCVQLQTEELVYLFLTWTEGSFLFEPGRRPNPDVDLVALPIENLLLEGSRRIDEASEHRNLGLALYRAGKLEDAHQEFTRILDLFPNNAEAEFRRGSIELKQGRFREAIRCLMRSIQFGDGTVGAFQNLVLALEGSGRIAEARLAAEEALLDFPEDPQLTLSLAVLLVKEGDLQGASYVFERYEQLVGRGAPPPAAYFTFSSVGLASSGRIEEAWHRVTDGLQHYPRSAVLLIHAACLSPDGGVARKLYRRAADIAPELVQSFRAPAEFGENVAPLLL